MAAFFYSGDEKKKKKKKSRAKCSAFLPLYCAT